MKREIKIKKSIKKERKKRHKLNGDPHDLICSRVVKYAVFRYFDISEM